jgi:dihydrofolate reductase
MGDLVVTTFMTLDGVMQAPGGPEEDTSGGFEWGGWQAPYGDEELGAFLTDLFERPGGFLLGRRTYEIFAGYWPKQTDPGDPIAAKLNALPKYVASRTLDSADWENSTVIRDVPDDVPAAKEQVDGELHVWGSADLIGSLLEHDLVDRHHVITYPVLLGSGKRLFPEGTAAWALRLAESRATGGGLVISTYERTGNRPEVGTVGEEG